MKIRNVNLVQKEYKKDKNEIIKEIFEKLLAYQNYKDVCTNKGFRVNYMITYTQEKKRDVLLL
jgi:hypothetical protein